MPDVVIVGVRPAGLAAAVSDDGAMPVRSLAGLHFAAIKIELAGLLREAARDGRRIARVVSHELRSEEAPRAVAALDA